ncbi:DegT/DnrJ/EryC1/StrS family aminotransferase [Fuerstiella marisgermanici]|uniref:UDP-4-amino-4-deoxy-L-arabinose--oxoglutarate aminotransferase n=1 Tax=Fuerstiella marisgermanici TaxID=1891926 RepID=A0A1P8WS34_9PLAN|nr:DegT/DnrJ/EryC1/StrS family aminotransferase [Fuerstiella marisgermanici]APZ96872.1 UDP-4-amino-4-deoxy-L-arabinose--oxoglutarate aminotransferase [Fuerstiella marisgermanici]
MRDTFLPFAPPLIGEEEIEEVIDTLRSGWLTTGPKTRRFADEFAEFTDAAAALTVSSCTAALHLALVANDVGEGDEVITTPLTFAASVNVIEHSGARPVLVDVEPDTLNIDPAKIEMAITPNTKAIIAVHYAGHPAELDEIREIAERHDLILIEDAAHAIGSAYKGQPIGSGLNPACFSFYATKNLTTGEGGMLTGESEFLEKARMLSLHGMSREAWSRYAAGGKWAYDIAAPGYKYNMTDIQAALGLQQLRRFESMQQRRRDIVSQYQEAFSGNAAFQTPVSREHVTHAWHLYVLRLNEGELSVNRNQFIEEVNARNIGTSVHFIPIHIHSYYAEKYGWEPDDFPVALDSFNRMVSLPLSPKMSDQDVTDVIDAVYNVVRAGMSRKAAA